MCQYNPSEVLAGQSHSFGSHTFLVSELGGLCSTISLTFLKPTVTSASCSKWPGVWQWGRKQSWSSLSLKLPFFQQLNVWNWIQHYECLPGETFWKYLRFTSLHSIGQLAFHLAFQMWPLGEPQTLLPSDMFNNSSLKLVLFMVGLQLDF